MDQPYGINRYQTKCPICKGTGRILKTIKEVPLVLTSGSSRGDSRSALSFGASHEESEFDSRIETVEAKKWNACTNCEEGKVWSIWTKFAYPLKIVHTEFQYIASMSDGTTRILNDIDIYQTRLNLPELVKEKFLKEEFIPESLFNALKERGYPVDTPISFCWALIMDTFAKKGL